jgi:sialate O-acetylesterase
MMRYLSVICLFLSLNTAFSQAPNQAVSEQLTVCRLFSNHGILQRQKPLPVWGKSKPNDTILVKLGTQSRSTVADTEGSWRVTFDPFEAAGNPYKMTVSNTTETLTINDLLMGEVWLCSGQSNMEWTVAKAKDYLKERKNADFPQIRHYFVEHDVSVVPEKEVKTGRWKICNAETVGDFTAVGFFFAREIYQKLGVPIGLLHSSWGGSQIEGWISKEAMATSNELKNYAQNLPKTWMEADNRSEMSLKKKLLGNPNANPTAEDEGQYLKPNYDFSKWLASNPMGQWDWKGIWAWRGNGFMATTVEIPSEMVKTLTTLGVAEMFGSTEIYINGKLIAAGLLRGPRKIIIPPNTWQSGVNKLVMKMNKALEPEWFGLGLQGSEQDLYVSNDARKISLSDADWRFMVAFSEPHSYVHLSNNVGTAIYNAMIAPLVPYGIRGVLWYQGESNAGRAHEYRKTFPLMIQDWRNKWQDDLPFYFAQLSSYGDDQNSNQGSNWAELREAQTLALKLPKTGMAVTTDIGNPKDIHPINKQDVGKRLAATALKMTYNQDVLPSGPLFESADFDAQKAVISFKYVGKGLIVKDRYGYLKGFEVAGDDRVFYYARAEIQGDKIVVYHPKGVKPTAVRYAWSDAPEEANLFNMDGFPASSFRTDDWQGVTVKNKFD